MTAPAVEPASLGPRPSPIRIRQVARRATRAGYATLRGKKQESWSHGARMAPSGASRRAEPRPDVVQEGAHEVRRLESQAHKLLPQLVVALPPHELHGPRRVPLPLNDYP